VKHGVKVAVLAGSIQVSEKVYRREGIYLALSTMKPGMGVDEAMEHAGELLASAAQELAVRIVR
jgi:glycerate kinase